MVSQNGCLFIAKAPRVLSAQVIRTFRRRLERAGSQC
jgi:hypothetical protein